MALRLPQGPISPLQQTSKGVAESETHVVKGIGRGTTRIRKREMTTMWTASLQKARKLKSTQRWCASLHVHFSSGTGENTRTGGHVPDLAGTAFIVSSSWHLLRLCLAPFHTLQSLLSQLSFDLAPFRVHGLFSDI